MLNRFNHDMSEEEITQVADTLSPEELEKSLSELQFFIHAAKCFPQHHSQVLALETEESRSHFSAVLARNTALYQRLKDYREAQIENALEQHKRNAITSHQALADQVAKLGGQPNTTPAQLELLATAKALLNAYEHFSGFEYKAKICTAATNILTSTTPDMLAKHIDEYRAVMAQNHHGKKRHIGHMIAGATIMFLGAALTALGAFLIATIGFAMPGTIIIGLGVVNITAGALIYRHGHQRTGHEALLHHFDDRASARKFGIFTPAAPEPDSTVPGLLTSPGI